MSSPAAILGALVLAAGKGTRMHSDGPKVMRRLLEEPMLRYVFAALEPLSSGRLWTVVGHGADVVRAAFSDAEARFIMQEPQLGTGHALQKAWPALRAAGLSHVLVVNGDTPLVTETAMRDFTEQALAGAADVAFLTLRLKDPGAFGRVVRRAGRVRAIVEAKDYDRTAHGPVDGEINAGIYCLRLDAVDALLPRLHNRNKNGEYYITDLVELAVADGLAVPGIEAGEDRTLLGINTPAELAEAEELLRRRLVAEAQAAGALIHAPDSVRIGPLAVVEPGAELTGPCELYGRSVLRKGARLDSHCVLTDTAVGGGTQVRSFCHLDGADIGPDCVVGPFTRMRPGTVLEEGAHAGSFVEIKKSRLRKGAKANHLAYIGDADVGEKANIGAGAITCNYDGKSKHATTIGTAAFVGSNVSLVAPVTVEDGAFVGAGSVITQTVPAGMLAVGRARQVNLVRKKKPE